ncbi:CHAT domain-containing protein [Actinosynnema sp. NPDC023658]|uniref:CHAT domain-containing protein n=1 Tax=Actinosynnema sp. NPDC023658 TaxID=3155465 RepID=UPI0033FA0F12
MRPNRVPPERSLALVGRAEALLSTGFVREATVLLRPAVDSRLPEALLLAARCAFRDHDFATARTLATDAEDLFLAQDRPSLVPAARAVALLAGGPGSPTAVADACDRHGHHDDAAEVRLRHAPGQAAALRHRGTSRSRALGWLARARLATTRRDAVAACRAGLALHDHDARGDLVDIALDHALSSADARSAWRWNEHRTAVPDPAVTRARAELRLARVRGDRDRIARLEREIRRLAHSPPAVGRPAVPLNDVVDALGDRALLVFISHRGRLFGVSVTGRRVGLHDFGEARTTARHVRSLSLADAPHALADLDRLLRPAGDRPLVVVPSPELVRMPWAALPSARGRALSVAPSTSCWHRADTRPLRLANRLWVAGPSLVHAHREVEALRRAHGGEVRSTVDGTLRGMVGADVAHIAAHGVRESRHGVEDELFSYLQLEDGPLHGHDLDGLAGAPSVVVLSACESGLARVLLRRGARVVVESVRAVPDDRVVDLMVDLHANLAQPAQALADAQARHGDLGFVCVGAG